VALIHSTYRKEKEQTIEFVPKRRIFL